MASVKEANCRRIKRGFVKSHVIKKDRHYSHAGYDSNSDEGASQFEEKDFRGGFEMENALPNAEKHYPPQSWFQGIDPKLHYGSLLLVGPICIQRILELPIVANEYGGYFFLIPFIMMYVLVAAPSFILESSLGQFTMRPSFLAAWSLPPLFRVLAPMLTFVRLVRTIIARVDPMPVFFIFDEVLQLFFGRHMASCDGMGKYCLMAQAFNCTSDTVPVIGKCLSPGDLPALHFTVAGARQEITFPPGYSRHTVANLHRDIGSYGIHIFFAITLVMVFSLRIANMNLRVATMMYYGSFFLFIAGLLLVWLGAFFTNHISLEYWLNDDLSKLYQPSTWGWAFFYAIEILGIADGMIITISSQLSFYYTGLGTSLRIVSSILCLTLFSFFTVVPVLHLSFTGNPLRVWDNVWTRDSFFFALTRVATRFDSFVFELIVCIFALALCLCQLAQTSISMKMQGFHHALSKRKFIRDADPWIIEYVTVVQLSIFVIIAVRFTIVSPEANFWLAYTSLILLPFIIFMMCIAVSWSYGDKLYYVALRQMYIYKTSNMQKCDLLRLLPSIMWKLVIPLICVIIWLSLTIYSIYTSWWHFLWFPLGIPLILLLLVGGIANRMWKQGTLLRVLFKTDPYWGPFNYIYRAEVIKAQVASRLI